VHNIEQIQSNLYYPIRHYSLCSDPLWLVANKFLFYVPVSKQFYFVHLYNDMVTSIDRREIGTLVLLDRAFDTTDHGIMLGIFRRHFSVGDTAVDSFASYLADQTKQVITGTESSSISQLLTSTPQESVLCPKCFVTYAEDVT